MFKNISLVYTTIKCVIAEAYRVFSLFATSTVAFGVVGKLIFGLAAWEFGLE